MLARPGQREVDGEEGVGMMGGGSGNDGEEGVGRMGRREWE